MKTEPGSLANALGFARKKGVRFWCVNGQLHFKAPKGVLTLDDLETLRASKTRIIALLELGGDSGSTEHALEPCPRQDWYPLSFNQLAHWNLHRLRECRALRQMASAWRLRGHLNRDALRASLAEVVRRQDALRTQIILRDGTPTQEIANSWPSALKEYDLMELPQDARDLEVLRLIDELILEPIDVATEPLFGISLLQLCEDEYVLIVAMEHIISDARSLDILLRVLFVCYDQAVQGLPFSLPPMPVQYIDYVAWLRNVHEFRMKTHGARWREYLLGLKRLRFPQDIGVSQGRSGWGEVPIRLGRELKAELQEWSRVRKTTLVMSVFTAYVGLVCRWCNVSGGAIQFAIDGRDSPKVENVIGYFASVLYLEVSLDESADHNDLLSHITDEYCNAYESADASYLESQVPRPEIARTTAFNWIPQSPAKESSALDRSDGELAISVVPFEHPMVGIMVRDNEPSIVLYDDGDEIDGSVNFPCDRFSRATMERFGKNFLASVRALLEHPEKLVKEVPLI